MGDQPPDPIQCGSSTVKAMAIAGDHAGVPTCYKAVGQGLTARAKLTAEAAFVQLQKTAHVQPVV